MSLFEIIQALSSILTMIGVGIAAYQLRASQKQSRTEFEEGLNERYRTIAMELPLDALLGKVVPPAELHGHLRAFYRYFDLSNEQAFLNSRRRISPQTWANWSEGIEQHLRRGAFREAWDILAPDLDGSFDYLRDIVARVEGEGTSPTARVSA